MNVQARETTLSRLEETLEPVRRAILADAHAEAERIVTDAHRAAGQLVDRAERDAEATVEQARRRAEAFGRTGAERALARARRDGHAAVLRAKDELRCELVDRVHAAAVDLRSDPRYPALLDHFEALARAQLGDAVEIEIERDPEPYGGIFAVAGSHQVDYRLPMLADRALDAIADAVASLWT